MSSQSGASRRALLTGAGMTLAGAGAAVLAGCGGAGTKSGRQAVKHVARPIQRADVAILGRMLALERRTVAAYTAGIPLLAKPDVKAAEQFLNEELLHAGELLSLIKAAGGHAPPHAASYDLGHPNDAGEVLALLHGLERALIAAYLTAIPRLSPGPVRAAVASILANDAQHISILRLFTGSSPVPSAFVTGDE